jgi:hypothetical protein
MAEKIAGKRGRKPKVKEDVNAVGFVGTTSVDTSNIVSPGDHISINFRMCPSIKVGPICLNRDRYTTIVPHNISSINLVALNKALNNGEILKGDTDTRPVKNQEVLDTYIEILNKNNITYMKPAIVALTTSPSTISNWQPKEILQRLRESESKGRNRRDIMNYLEEAIRCCKMAGLSDEDFNPDKHMRGVIQYRPVPKGFGK